MHRIEDKVFELYADNMGEKICSLPLIYDGPFDRMVWFHTTNGCYSTKIDYCWLLLNRLGLIRTGAFGSLFGICVFLPKLGSSHGAFAMTNGLRMPRL